MSRLQTFSTRTLRLYSTHTAKKPGNVVFSGIQPTGVPHLGNYLGAMANWVKLQKEAQPSDTLIYSVVGLHAITVPRDPKILAQHRKDMMAFLLAIGLNPERSIIFHQEQVPEHAELSWILGCLVPVGHLQRMTSWKAKLALLRNSASEDEVQDSQLLAGLFQYPVLQAADILLYNTTHVPVGLDQQQHLELTRDIAEMFNKRYKYKFPLPEFVRTSQAKVLSLRNPEQKMSKSDPNTKATILLTDNEREIKNKIKSAVTDEERVITYEPERRPGVSNLIDMIVGVEDLENIQQQQEQESQAGQTVLTHEMKAEQVAKRFDSASQLKEGVTEALVKRLNHIQEQYNAIQQDKAYLHQIESLGREKASEIAVQTMTKVRKSLGFS